MIKFNNKSINGKGASSLIEVGEIVDSWASDYEIILIRKEIIDYNLIEQERHIKIKGMVQNLSTQELQLMPEGMRNWKHYKLLSTTHFKNDDILIINNKRFRITGTDNDDTYYGFWRYYMVEDYEKEQPEEEEEECL